MTMRQSKAYPAKAETRIVGGKSNSAGSFGFCIPTEWSCVLLRGSGASDGEHDRNSHANFFAAFYFLGKSHHDLPIADGDMVFVIGFHCDLTRKKFQARIDWIGELDRGQIQR